MAQPEARNMTTITVTNVMPSSRTQPVFMYRRRPSTSKMSPFRRATIVALAVALVLTLFSWLAFTNMQAEVGSI
jgi:hypothetical protein